MTSGAVIPLEGTVIDPGNPEAMAESLIPFMDDVLKDKYLALRACGFTIREAVHLIPSERNTTGHLSEAAVRRWRDDDSKFAEAERNIRTYRDVLAKEHLNIEFTRNYALILQKDFDILQKSMRPVTKTSSKVRMALISNGMTPEDADAAMEKAHVATNGDEPLTKQEHDYLLRARSHYTPQQLAILKQLVGKSDGNQPSWVDFVMEISRREERVRIEGRAG